MNIHISEDLMKQNNINKSQATITLDGLYFMNNRIKNVKINRRNLFIKRYGTIYSH